MRSDYALYTMAIIFFILTGTVAAYQATQSLWIVTTAVLGLVFIGLGYSQRPRQTVATEMAVAPPPPAPPKVPEVVEEKKPELEPQAIVEVKPPSAELLEVKGIGEKRAAQLKDLGINTIEELTRASAQDLAAKLKISPKVTGKWIENAKVIVEKS